ncbi:hypothetical protein [Clostridium estertheticum]|uniref:hypothetical protein n=1 Tax=Clostridium estertheticum TaxID=238834 RepID=UPI001CF3F920|nr:hypothetical protein [Clostridium estertheticum]MCB2359431.1 hypothetical protein [Clostridium estertheticum]
MAFDYFLLSVKDRCLYEYKLKDWINEVDKIAMASLVFIFIAPIVSIAMKNYALYTLLLNFVLYGLIGIFVVCKVYYYKICKLYIEVIISIKNKEIIQVGNYAKEIRFINKEK